MIEVFILVLTIKGMGYATLTPLPDLWTGPDCHAAGKTWAAGGDGAQTVHTYSCLPAGVIIEYPKPEPAPHAVG